MFSEKQKRYISIVSIILAVIFIITSTAFGDKLTAVTVSSSSNIENVLDKDSVRNINIEIDEETWKSLLENATDEEYVNANIIIDDEKFYNIGIRAKGNSSLSQVASNDNTDRFSFKIDFSEYVDNQTYHGIEKLALNNMISDPSYMKEALSYDVYELLGIAVPEYSYANISINGESWGLYLALEVMEERFIEKNYGELEGNLYKPESMEMGGNKDGNGNNNGGKPDMTEGGNRPNRPNMENGEVPEAPNGEIPSGEVPERPNGEIPSGEVPERPNGEIPSGEAPEMLNENMNPMDNSKPLEMVDRGVENGEVPQMPSEGVNGKVQEDNADNKDIGGMPGGRGSNGGDLKYIDDNASSYSAIKDNIIFKTTTDDDFNKVIEMIKNLNNGENLEKYLNIEGILKYFAVNTFLVNLDSYSGGMYHNYYLYEKDGLFDILPWDLNMSFGGYGTSDSSAAINFPIDSPVKGSLENAPLINELLKVDEYRELYHSYLKKIADEYMNNGVFENLVIKLNKLIGDCVKADKTAFYSYEEYKNSIPELLTFGKDRTTSVLAQLEGSQPSTEYGNVETNLNLKALGSMGGGAGGKGNRGNEEVNNLDNNQFEGKGNTNNNNISQEAMIKVQELLRNKSFEELTEEEKNELEKLGVTSENIEDININFKNIPGRNMDKMANAQVSGTTTNTKVYIISMVIITLLLASSLLYVNKFKRKR